ncbi:MAG: CRISPR-associated helicase Cas3' [Anaeromicrobium sp.]|jgi:CRISPR-associated endonuclease/helicase Cas3|uniref:CRISPR-associated helicase Cas3' n=1 Tax=Anaeromicrobium sp. TaxID=1929132 RepID=UPI0025F5BF0A|nr:CRISPR-associated helicase Cas3' [Anaeromicrobium sp.]MCT4594745.1 CRISPR-associated helicase Cas3' [Anaeromicrobium sp.]
MCFSFNIKAHDHQSLYTHLREVSRIAIETHKNNRIKGELTNIIDIICMGHDFAKATTYFQRHLKGEKEGLEKNHSQLSAFFTYWLLPEEYKHMGFLIVKKHHGDMKNSNDEVKYTKMWDFSKQIEDMTCNHKEELEYIYKDYLGNRSMEDFFSWVEDIANQRSVMKSFRKKKYSLSEFLEVQYVYGLLLTADKSQLILKDTFMPEEPYESTYMESYKDNLIEESLIKNPKLKESHIFELRNSIYEDLVKELEKIHMDRENIFSINVPTGSGKTILSYKCAMYMAKKIYDEKNIHTNIIYSLPFTSVIDQNHQVLEEIIKHNEGKSPDNDQVLKYHSSTPIEYKYYEGFDARFCFENWQSKIITTTFVQFFNTIFKTGKNSISHRFHRLANSIVILDEVQAIGEKYYFLIKEFLEILGREYNTKIILVTATLPMLLDTKELIKDKEKYFRALDRIEIHNHSGEGTYMEDFKEILLEDIEENQDKSFLIVLNTVKSSKDIYNHLKDMGRKIIYLSTEIYPKKRLEIIDKIKKSKEKYIVVSTQLIEAGVDIDMDIVYRDFAPLDSINQTAGRANRNGVGGRGTVKLYKLVDENERKYCTYIYPRFLLNNTEKVLSGKDVIREKHIYDMNEEYFKRVKSGISNDYSKDMMKFIEKLKYEDFRNMFELIDKDEFLKVDIIVNGDHICQKLLEKIQEDNLDMLEVKNAFRLLNQYRISVLRKELHNINTKSIHKYNLLYINKEDYGKEGAIRKSTMQL